MKSIIYLACFILFGASAFAQDINFEKISETSKEISTKISQELNFDDDRSHLLHRAIYSTKLSYRRAEHHLGDNPEKLKAAKDKIDEAFPKYLSNNFSRDKVTSSK